MKKILIILTSTLFISLPANGQNLFFMDEESYPFTESFTLQANSDKGYDLNVFFAKEGTTELIAVSTISNTGVTFSGKLIIYLNDGTVITCIDRGKTEHVDNSAKAIYSLTNEELNKIKESKINTIRYTLKCAPCFFGDFSLEEGNWSASNKENGAKTDNPDSQTDIMNRTKNALAGSNNAGSTSTSEGVAGGPGNQGVSSGSVDSKVRGDGGGSGNNGISYDLQGRSYQKLPAPKYDYQGEGRIVVEVSVDREGKVIKAIPGIKGSTTLDEYLMRVAKEAALKARFEANPSAPAEQKGSITYNFMLK
jgi:hypothetical protein